MLHPAVPSDHEHVEEKTFLRRVVSFSESLCKISGVIAGVGIFILVLLVVNDVVMRYIVNRPTVWGLEISSYLLLYIAALSLCYVMVLERHVRIDMFVIHFSPRIQNLLNLFAFAVCFLFGVAMSWITAETSFTAYHEWWRSNSQLMFPLFPIHVLMPIGFVLFTLECMCKIYFCISRFSRYGKKG